MVPGIVALAEWYFTVHLAVLAPAHTQAQVLHHSLAMIPCHPFPVHRTSQTPVEWAEADPPQSQHTDIPHMASQLPASGSLVSSLTPEAIYQTWDPP